MAKYLALDIGEKRIGVATADIAAPFPAPLVTLEATGQLADQFNQLLKKHQVEAVIIGFPRNQKGERTAQTDRVEYIAGLLNIPKNIPVYWQDESLTSVKAEAELKKRKKPYKKADVDSLAATYILEDFIAAGGTQTKTASSVEHSTVAKGGTQKKRQPKLITKLLVGILIASTAVIITAVGWYLYALSPKTAKDSYTVVSIQAGISASEIAKELEQKQVIRSALAFRIYIKLQSINGLQAGEYRLSSKQSSSEIASILSDGKVTSVNVLIPPGQRTDQIVDLLKKSGFKEQDIQNALNKLQSHPTVSASTNNPRLEGYLYADTYQIGPSTSAEELLNLMLSTFQKRLNENPEITSGLKAQGLTLEQAVIIASIVQQEVPDYETQRKVAQVFIKRFKEGIALGADPTFKYAAAVEGGPSNPSNSSRFNTRKYVGLPPTAIGNFNITALKAVANPSQTDYLYFVAGDDKITRFSNTLEEHERLTREYCTVLCN